MFLNSSHKYRIVPPAGMQLFLFLIQCLCKSAIICHLCGEFESDFSPEREVRPGCCALLDSCLVCHGFDSTEPLLCP